MGAIINFISNILLLYIMIGFVLYILFMITTYFVMGTLDHRHICAVLEDRYGIDLSRMKQESPLSAQTKVFLTLVTSWVPIIFSKV